jgi:exonuclease III
MFEPSSRKRALESTARTVSPPARRRKSHASDSNDHVGADPSLELSTKSIKVVSWNVNGVGPFFQRRLDRPDASPLRSKLKRLGWPQLCCLQEVKINSKDAATQRRLHHAANEGHLPGEPTYNAEFSLPRDPHNAKGFGGKVHGVASLIRRDFLPHISTTRRPDWDLEGRILIHETTMRLIIFNGYWVNATDAPWRNSRGKPEGTRHDLKLRYHTLILKEVLIYQERGFHVLLVGDMNVALDMRDGYPRLRTSPARHVKNRQDFNCKFFLDEAGMRGIDLFRHIHGDERKYTYYSSQGEWGSSCDRVDHLIGSSSMVERSTIIDADICNTREDAAHSDHVPLWVNIDPSKLDLP